MESSETKMKGNEQLMTFPTCRTLENIYTWTAGGTLLAISIVFFAIPLDTIRTNPEIQFALVSIAMAAYTLCCSSVGMDAVYRRSFCMRKGYGLTVLLPVIGFPALIIGGEALNSMLGNTAYFWIAAAAFSLLAHTCLALLEKRKADTFSAAAEPLVEQ